MMPQPAAEALRVSRFGSPMSPPARSRIERKQVTAQSVAISKFNDLAQSTASPSWHMIQIGTNLFVPFQRSWIISASFISSLRTARRLLHSTRGFREWIHFSFRPPAG